MAGMATMAPIGTVATPARISATSQGRPAPWAKWENAAAPTAANAAWHSDTCPDVCTSSRSDRNTRTKTRALEYTGRREPTA